jgi:hypothetical protein
MASPLDDDPDEETLASGERYGQPAAGTTAKIRGSGLAEAPSFLHHVWHERKEVVQLA